MPSLFQTDTSSSHLSSGKTKKPEQQLCLIEAGLKALTPSAIPVYVTACIKKQDFMSFKKD
ncbi:hypothetical protein GCM10008014_46860 [Paenibacillus silvae]|uniref:Uncharacterized protein n=1 Tax=Paenibacillus silvae TaxID=1325358 RepID=A0ABQ1ZJB6_9BACL|nr:hypothetical protein GCM10008014_46860 [Paenibacillus silvae]